MKYNPHLSISISDTTLRFVLVSHNEQGFFVSDFGEYLIEKGVVVKGEIIKAAQLSSILKEIKQKAKAYKKLSYSCILPHTLFTFDTFELKGIQEISKKKDFLKKYLEEHQNDHSWVSDHSYLYHTHGDVVHIEALQQELYTSYITLLEASGYKGIEIHSDISSLRQKLKSEPSVVIEVSEDMSFVMLFEHGALLSYKTFEFSYKRLIADIVSHISVDTSFAHKVLKKYGVSRAHQDASVYQRIKRSLAPMLDYLRLNKSITKGRVYLWKTHEEIVGMDDVLTRVLHTDVESLNVVQDEYHEVLDIHKDELPRYVQLLLTATQSMKREL